MRVALPVLVLSLFAAPGVATAQRDACSVVDCSGAGTCYLEHGAPHCLCEPGRAAVGSACVEVEEPDVMRLRRDPTAGERVADLASSQVGRWRRQVGRGVEGLALAPLPHYLGEDEWWCTDFVAWIYAAAGVPFTQGGADGWLVTTNRAMRAWFEQRGLWHPRGADAYEPEPGDYVRIDTEGGGHSAIVHHVEGTTLVTVEGNVSGLVELGRYPRWRESRQIDGIGQLSPGNDPPEVDAGADEAVLLPDALALRGEASDDGPEARLAVSWDALDGPRGARFADATAASTEVRFPGPGTYRLRLRAHDGEHDVADTITVRAIRNAPPSVSAVATVISAFDGAAQLAGVAEDDGQPGPLSLRWSQVDGPGVASFDAPYDPETGVVLPEGGRYVLRLTAEDGREETSADVVVEMPAWPGGCAAAPPRGPTPLRSLALFLALALLARGARG